VAGTRYRCTACGNLTRFDVTVNRRSRAFHHYSLGGELQIDDLTILSERIEEVSCRWCGSSANVVEFTEDPLVEPPVVEPSVEEPT
jgi:hypothetical protein